MEPKLDIATMAQNDLLLLPGINKAVSVTAFAAQSVLSYYQGFKREPVGPNELGSVMATIGFIGDLRDLISHRQWEVSRDSEKLYAAVRARSGDVGHKDSGTWAWTIKRMARATIEKNFRELDALDEMLALLEGHLELSITKELEIDQKIALRQAATTLWNLKRNLDNSNKTRLESARTLWVFAPLALGAILALGLILDYFR